MLEEAKHYLEDSQQLEENILQLVNEEGDVKSQFRSLVLQQLGIENTGMVSKLNISKDGFNQEGRWTYKLALTLRPHYVWSNAILNKIKDACIVDKTLVISNLASEKFFADLRRQKLFEYLKNAQPVSLATLDETKFYNKVKQLISPDNEGVYTYLLNNNLGFVNSFFVRSIAKTLGIPMYWEIGSIQINPSYRLLDGCYVVDLYLSYDKSNNVIWDKLENQGSIIQENSELSLSKKTICIHNVPTSYSYHNGFIKTRNVLNNQKKALSNYLLHKHTENNSQPNTEATSSSQLLNNFNPGGFVSQRDYSKWLIPVGIKEVEAIRSVRVITYRYQTKEGNYEIALEVTLKRDYQWSNLDGIIYPYQIKDDNQILIRVPTSLSHTQLLLDLSQLDCLKKQAMDADILAKYARLHYLDDNQNIKPLFLTDWLEALKITAKNYSRIQNIHVDHLDNDSVMIVQIKLNEPYKFKLIGDYDHYLYEVNNEYHQIRIRFNLK